MLALLHDKMICIIHVPIENIIGTCFEVLFSSREFIVHVLTCEKYHDCEFTNVEHFL